MYLLSGSRPVGFIREGEHFACLWMAEGYFGGMQIKAVGRFAIEGIAEDGEGKPIGMGTMNAQLVGATGEGEEGEES